MTVVVHNEPRTKFFGREPAALITLVGAAINVGLAFGLPWTPEQVSLVNAAVSALIGLAIAWFTKDGLLAVTLGVMQALLSVAVGFGLSLTDDQQAAFIAFLNVFAGIFNRQTTSPTPVPQLDLGGTSGATVVEPIA